MRMHRTMIASAAAIVIAATGMLAIGHRNDVTTISTGQHGDAAAASSPTLDRHDDLVLSDANPVAVRLRSLVAQSTMPTARVVSSGGILHVIRPDGSQLVPVANRTGGTAGFADAAVALEPDPVVSYRNCIAATRDPDAWQCADMRKSAESGSTGRVWLGPELVRALPLTELDRDEVIAYETALGVISPKTAADMAALRAIASCIADADRDPSRFARVGCERADLFL